VISVSSNKNETKSERERDEANYNYFVSLADSRASLTNLPMMALLTAILLSITGPWLGSLVFYAGYPALLPLFYAQIAILGFSLLMIVLSAFRWWVFRHQVLASSFTVFFAVVGWVYALCFISICMATVEIGPFGSTEFSSTRLLLTGIVGPLYVCGATLAHVLLLRRRLREGHSEKRTMGNYLAASSVYSSRSLWIIFAVAVIGPNVITGGRYVLATAGLLMFLLFASVVTSLPVEFGYLTYLKARDKKYWEERPPKIVMERAQKIAVLKKVGKWALIVLAVVVALVLLPMVWP
jgi:hypothetical protein